MRESPVRVPSPSLRLIVIVIFLASNKARTHVSTVRQRLSFCFSPYFSHAGPNPDNPQDATQEYDNQEDWGYEWGNEGGDEWGDEDEDPNQHPFPEGSSEEEESESKENHDYY